jgi:hypothetical protein
METIPTDPTLLYWDQTTSLDGTPYVLSFRFNNREQVYYLTISSTDGTETYVAGLKLVSDVCLLGAYATPPGELMAYATGPDDSPARVGDWGTRVNLYYLTQAEMIAAGVDPTRNPYA